MNVAQSLLVGAALLLTTRVSFAKDFIVKDGLTLQARAYIDLTYAKRESSRYDVVLAKSPKDGHKWDFTFDNDPNYHYTGLTGNIARVPYKDKAKQKTTTVKLTLHQYETLDERITFKDLNLMPRPPRNEMPSRLLSLKESVTQTTPSGIFITIPAQQYKSIYEALADANGAFIFNGNANAIFFDVQTSPNQREVVLPKSPLYQQYKKPVTIKLECVQPNYMVWYMADNTFKRLAVGLPNLAKIERLDKLTIIVRQRVELRSIPVVLQVPIEAR